MGATLALVSSRSSKKAERESVPRHFAEQLRAFPEQLRLALGPVGARWAAAAALIGLACSAVSLAAVVIAQQDLDVAQHRRDAARLANLDQTARVLIRTIPLIRYGKIPPAETGPRLREAWNGFEDALKEACGEQAAGPSQATEAVQALCRQGRSLHERMAPKIDTYATPGSPLDPSLLVELAVLGGAFNDARMKVTQATDLLVDRMADDYANTLLVLILSTAGFGGAGLVLLLLVGRASVRHHQQSRSALQSAAEAIEARDVLHETIEAVPAGVVVYDRDERLVLFNSAAAKVNPSLLEPDAIGMSFEEMCAVMARRIEAEGRTPVSTESMLKRFREGGTVRPPYKIGGRWLELSEHKTPDGRTVGVRVDITDLKNQEIDAARARARYQTLVDSLSDVVFELDGSTGRLTYISASVAGLLERPAAEVTGTSFLNYIAPASKAEVVRQVSRPWDANDTARFYRFEVVTASGTTKAVEVHSRRRIDDDGRVITTGVIRDIEERIRLEQQLADETARLRSIFETGGVVMALMAPDLRYLTVNPDFCAAVGLPMDKIIGRTPYEILGGVGLDIEMLARWRAGPLKPGQDDAMRYTRTFRDRAGRRRFFPTTVKPIADQDGNLQQMLLLAVDDTERRATEQALFDAERLTTVGEMAGTLAHELSQPLQVINIACASAADELELAREGGRPLNGEFLEGRITRIRDQLDRATRIMNELRAFVRGSAEDPATRFDPALAVRGAIDLTSHGILQSGSTVSTALAPDLPALMGHLGRLEQVLINLLNNARDAGAPTITVSADVTHREGRDLVRIAVDDTGPGIAPSVMPRLFESLVTTKPRGKGTGLGLRICRRIIEEMSGTITAANRAGGGARFEILLPAMK